MSQSIASSFVYFLLFVVLCPNTWGDQGEREDQNTVKVHSITMSENNTGRICLAINVIDPKSKIKINLDNLTDLQIVKDSLEINNDSGAPVSAGHNYKGKRLEVDFDSFPKGKYFISYQDPTITFSIPEYRLHIQQNEQNVEISKYVTVKNFTQYDWESGTILKHKISKGKIQKKNVYLKQGKERPLALERADLPLHPKYIVDMAYYPPNRDIAFPHISLDIVELWKMVPITFNEPGSILIKNQTIDYRENFNATVFQKFIKTKDLRLYQKETVILSRTKSKNEFVALKSSDKSELKTELYSEYKYKLTGAKLLGVLVQLNSKSKPLVFSHNQTQLITHVTSPDSLPFLIDTQTPFDKIAVSFKEKSQLIGAIIKLMEMIDQNSLLNNLLENQSMQLGSLNDLSNRVPDSGHGIPFELDPLNQLINQLEESIQSSTPNFATIDLSKIIKQETPFKISYTQIKDFEEQREKVQKSNQAILTHLKLLSGYAATISSLLKNLPTDDTFQKTLYVLAASGKHDVDATLLRKQREQHAIYAKNFIEVYNVLVKEKLDITPIQIDLPPHSSLANRQRNSTVIPGDFRLESIRPAH